MYMLYILPWQLFDVFKSILLHIILVKARAYTIFANSMVERTLLDFWGCF